MSEQQEAAPEQIEQFARILGAAAKGNTGMHADCTVCAQTVKPEPHQQRMLDEHAELSDRISKLEAYTGTEMFEQIPEQERCLLNHQLIAMHSYAGILRHRIRLWSKSDD